MGNVVRPSVSTEWASAATLNNGANTTANKVEPTATHKSVGYGYPEQPARNHTNWWMNSVYQWFDYIDSWITKWGSINKNFAINDVSTTGLTFAYNAGKVSVGVFTNLTAIAGTLTLSDGDGTYSVYFDCIDSTVKKLVATVPTSLDTIVPLYSVPVVAGAIDTANIVDLRTFNTIRKASAAEVLAGTDNDKYLTPFTALQLVLASATTSIFGKVRLADSTDVAAQTGNDVLTAGALAFPEMNGSISRYGTVRLADTSDIAARTGDDVLTASHLNDANARATTSAYGVTKLADNTDLLLANRAANNDVLTAASLTQTNMQAAEASAGIAALATQADVNAGSGATTIVTPATLSASPATCTAWVSFAGRNTNGAATINNDFNVISVDRIAAGRYQLTFYNTLPNVNYCVTVGNIAGSSAGTNGVVYSSGGWNSAPTDKTTTTLTVQFGAGDGTGRDVYEGYVTIFG